MRFRELGSTGIQVSEVGLGCWPIGGASFRGGSPTGWSGVDVMASIETVRCSWAEGVTFYDTADAYGRGKSEVLVGLGLYGNKEDAVICTKVGMSLAAPGQDFSEPYILGALDASLTRLERDFVDLYLLHGPPLEGMTDALFGLMNDLKGSGKIRAWGVSISPVDTSDVVVEEGLRAIEGGAEAIQLVYNLLQQKEGDALFPAAMEKGVGMIARVPLASGWLTGKLQREYRVSRGRPAESQVHARQGERDGGAGRQAGFSAGGGGFDGRRGAAVRAIESRGFHGHSGGEDARTTGRHRQRGREDIVGRRPGPGPGAVRLTRRARSSKRQPSAVSVQQSA